MTQQSILDLINEIQPAAFYPADKMNSLLTNILAAAYGPFYFGEVPPGDTDDENNGYRPGSVGYDASTKRYYVCQSALAGNAVWILIPADSSFQLAGFANPLQVIACETNTTVVKCTNNSIGSNQGCRLKLPPNPYTGKTVIVYCANSFLFLTLANSANVAINGGTNLTIPEKQQYTITYSGTAWEIVGVSNITPSAISNVDVANSGGVVTSDTNKLTFLGTGATIANDLAGGTNITINPLTGLDIKEGGTTTKASAQFLNFNANNFNVAVNGTGADVDYVSTFKLFRSSTPVGDINSIRFGGPAFDWNGINTITISSGIGQIYLDGFKPWYGNSSNPEPDPADGVSLSYSTGSIGTYLNRVYICTSNSDDGAVWNRVSEDYGVQLFGGANNFTDYVGEEVASVIIPANPDGAISNYTIQLADRPYVGKVVTIYIGRTILDSFKVNTANGFTAINKSGVMAVPAESSFSVVCTSTALQGQWLRLK
jgi:hypothetical protein